MLWTETKLSKKAKGKKKTKRKEKHWRQTMYVMHINQHTAKRLLSFIPKWSQELHLSTKHWSCPKLKHDPQSTSQRTLSYTLDRSRYKAIWTLYPCDPFFISNLLGFMCIICFLSMLNNRTSVAREQTTGYLIFDL